MDSAVEIRERKEKHRSQYQRQKKKQQRLQFGKLETDGSLKKEKKTSAETDGGHFQAEKNDVSTNRKKGKQKYSRKTIKTYQEVDKAARKQEAERQNKIPKDSVYTKKTNEEQKAKVKYHLYFDKKTGKTDGKKKTLSSVPKKALKNAVYQKAGEDEKENSAVDAAHKLVRSGEWILQEHSSRNIRKNRSQIHKENRLEKRVWKSASRYQYQKYLEEHPEMQKKLIRKLESNLALIAVVGRGMKNSVGNAANVISALSNAKINVKMIDQGSSELNIIVGVRNRYFEAAIRAIYDVFIPQK